MSATHPAPAAHARKENIGEFRNELSLLLRLQHEVSEALLLRGQRRKYSSSNPKIWLAHVRALFGAFKTKGDASEIICIHHLFFLLRERFS
jgi:hypothetical protein